MTAFEQNIQTKKLEEKDAGNMDLGRRIFELFMCQSLDTKAALAAMKVIPMQSELGKKWIHCWKATILLEATSFEQPSTQSQAAQLKRQKQGRKILKNLLPDSFDAQQPASEREVVFLGMLTLGRYDAKHGDQKERARACDMLAQLTTSTERYGSPLREEAAEAFDNACRLLLEGYRTTQENTSRNGMRGEQLGERKVAKTEDAA